MTDLTLALKLLADATSAVQGLQKVKSEVQQTGTAARGLGDEMTGAGQDGTAAFTAISAKLSEAMREIDLLKTKMAGMQMPRSLPTDTDRVGQAAKGSAGQVANLTAQFNDIGMMMASGQNPLMTAIQQGSQVGQALGPMGAAGAAKALGDGFMALLNPMNLGVMAAIALGSTLVQWLFSAGEEAKSLGDALADLKSAVTEFQQASHRSLAELQKDFGAVTPEVKRLNNEMADLAGVQALLAATEAMRGLKAETEGSWWAIFTDKAFTDAGQAAAMLGVGVDVATSNLGKGTKTNPLIQQFQDAVAAAQSAEGLDAQLEAWGRVKAVIAEAAGGVYSMTTAQGELYNKVLQTEKELRRLKAAQTSGITPQGGRAEAGFAPTPEDLKAWADLAARRKAAVAATGEEIAENQRVAAILQQIALYGEDSANAALARLQAERDVYEAQKQQGGITGTLLQDALDSWDAANGMADAQKAAADEMDNARQAGSDLHDVLKDAWDATVGLNNAAPGAGWMDNAISGVDALIGRLGDAIAAARRAAAAGGADGTGMSFPDYVAGNRGLPIRSPFGAIPSGLGMPPVPTAPETGTGTGTGTRGGGGTNPLASLQAQAREAMVQLDQSIAAINEKVAVGLTSTADAAGGVTSAKEQAANALAELIAQLDDMGPAGQKSAAELRIALQGMADDLKAVGTVGEGLGKSLGEGLKAPLADFILGTKTATQAFDDFVGNMAQTIATKLANRFTDSLITPFLDSAIGALFPGLKFATGGVPGIGAFSNQVLDRSTLFALPGGGLGEAGEAGREAIMPLKEGAGGPSVRAWMGGDELELGLMRGADGNLGVRLPEWRSPVLRAPLAYARGGMPGRDGALSEGDGLAPGTGGGRSAAPSGNVYVNVTNNADNTKVQQTERMQGNDRFVEVMIDTIRHAIADDIVGGRGPVPNAIQGTYGAARMGR